MTEHEAFARYQEHLRICSTCTGAVACQRGQQLHAWWKRLEASEQKARRSDHGFESVAEYLPAKERPLWPEPE